MRRSSETSVPQWAAMALMMVIAAGCGPGDSEHRHDETAPAHEEAHGHGHAHEEEDESSAGASFKPGKGVIITKETQKIIGLEIADVAEESLGSQTRFTAQIFGEKHSHLPNPADHSGCDVHGSGLVSEEIASVLKPGDPVQVQLPTNGPLQGVVLAIQKSIALGEAEVIVGISNAISVLRPGEFVPTIVIHPADQATTTVPKSALLRTAEGTFVYTVNGDAFYRTAVRTGAESDGRVAIIDGLLAGDQVVVKPVQTLWLIELRATKGGGHSH
ncbi:MAG: hypothetical protein IT581_22415 [Verrucomicrobiales bacterium]|nr:hypothetical protein [Verrucomicrobiales bacterium]